MSFKIQQRNTRKSEYLNVGILGDEFHAFFQAGQTTIDAAKDIFHPNTLLILLWKMLLNIEGHSTQKLQVNNSHRYEMNCVANIYSINTSILPPYIYIDKDI